MLRKCFFFLFLASAFFMSAQENEGRWYVNKPISNFEFTGLKTVRYNDIIAVIGEYRGQPYTDSLFTEIQLKLYSMEVFKGQITAEPFKIDEAGTRVGLRFFVEEREKISSIQFVGIGGLNEGDLRSVIQSKERDIINTSQIRLDAQAIRDKYLEDGFIQATVTHSIEPVDDNQVDVIFTISEGRRTTVKAILFEGLVFGSPEVLKGQMSTKEIGLFQNGIFNEVNLIRDRQTIEAWYRDRGYIDAKIVNIDRNLEVNPETGQNNLTLQFNIEEGQEYTFGGMEFSGNQIFTVSELEDRVRHRVGAVLNKSRLDRDRDIQSIYDLYQGNGFIFNEIRFEEIREENIIRFKVQIIEKDRARIENIIIRGNTKTQEDVILRELPFEVGDIYSFTKIRQGIMNLYNTQYFELVEPQSPPGSAEGLMDLVINVEEAQTTSILLAIAFSGVERFPITGQVSWNDSNFQGTGQKIGVQAQLSPVTQSLDLSYSNNWLFDQRFRAGGSLSFPTYDDQENGVPDPYDAGVYVFTRDTNYLGTDYKAGDVFPEYISDSNDPRISQYNLQREFDYDRERGQLRTGENLMGYDSFDIRLTGNLGYTWSFPAGRLALGLSGGPSLSYVTYDESVNRPFEKSLRDNLNTWQWVNRIGINSSFDARDVFYYPNNGYYFSQSFSQAGGFLQGIKNFIRSETKAEGYIKLWDVNFLGDNIFRGVLAAKTSFSHLFPALGGPDNLVLLDSDKLFVTGMLQGRGWGYTMGGLALWTQNIELRIPFPINELNPQPFFSWETFIDGFVLMDDVPDRNFANYAGDLQNYKFSLGTGIRITNPQIPLGFYLAKPFRFDENNQIEWQEGDGILGDLDLKFVFAITVDF